MRAFYAPYQTQQKVICEHIILLHPVTFPLLLPLYLAPLTQQRTDKINISQTKTALHRTRLHVLDQKKISVLFFYKPDRQPAPVPATSHKKQTAKIERNYIFFQ
ncbi:hypothetical protein [Enterobacter sp.]|uniref:hypothetical protein n=1 Tax=Enterobacter sp. TaxID=42895 RepID=UPI00296FB38A|nr:hypothetical protein [Enterobacter sp.]